MNVPADQYAWWRNALAGNVGLIHDGDPQSGRYRLRNKNKGTGEITYRPVAYWRDDSGKLFCRVGDRMMDEQRAAELWTYCAKEPITSEVYKAALATGQWPDVHPAAQADRTNHADLTNSPNAPDPNSLDAIKDSVENLAREAELLIEKGGAKSKGESDRAADLADRLRKLEVKADERRKQEHEPFKAEIKKIDGLWNPVRDMAGSAKERLKKFVVTPFLKALDEQANALRENAVKIGAPLTAQEGAALDQVARTVAGTTGRAALRTNKSATITDYAKALAYFAENAKVKDLIQQLANQAVRGGTTPDGCEVHEEKVAA